MDENGGRRKALLDLFETANTVSWLFLDISWLMQARTAAVVLAIPTVLTCIPIVVLTEKRLSLLLVSGAVTAWACMNVFWIMHDFKILSWGLAVAKTFALVETACLLTALAASSLRREAWDALRTRFRRLRIGRR